MQEMAGVFEPDYGHLFDVMRVEANAVIDIEALIGWAFLGLAVLQFVKLARTAVQAGREASR